MLVAEESAEQKLEEESETSEIDDPSASQALEAGVEQRDEDDDKDDHEEEEEEKQDEADEKVVHEEKEQETPREDDRKVEKDQDEGEAQEKATAEESKAAKVQAGVGLEDEDHMKVEHECGEPSVTESSHTPKNHSSNEVERPKKVPEAGPGLDLVEDACGQVTDKDQNTSVKRSRILSRNGSAEETRQGRSPNPRMLTTSRPGRPSSARQPCKRNWWVSSMRSCVRSQSTRRQA